MPGYPIDFTKTKTKLTGSSLSVRFNAADKYNNNSGDNYTFALG